MTQLTDAKASLLTVLSFLFQLGQPKVIVIACPLFLIVAAKRANVPSLSIWVDLAQVLNLNDAG